MQSTLKMEWRQTSVMKIPCTNLSSTLTRHPALHALFRTCMTIKKTVEYFDSAGIRTLFVFEPTQKRMKEVTIALRQFAYPTKVIVVSNGNFSAHNSHIPSSALLHSFLLNSANAVTIVGNPLRNEKLKELMLNNIE